jgi:hypothetical protein
MKNTTKLREASYKPPPWEASNLTYLAGRAHLDGADALAIDMDRKWGNGRLRLLISADLRERFDRQRLKLDEAILTGGVADVQREADRMCNAWRALDAAAEASGAKKLSLVVWEAPLANGRTLALVRTHEEAAQVISEGRAVEVWTLEEVVRVVQNFPALGKAKATWPGATVVGARRPTDPLDGLGEVFDDPMPF